jgi:hypothetical protein
MKSAWHGHRQGRARPVKPGQVAAQVRGGQNGTDYVPGDVGFHLGYVQQGVDVDSHSPNAYASACDFQQRPGYAALATHRATEHAKFYGFSLLIPRIQCMGAVMFASFRIPCHAHSLRAGKRASVSFSSPNAIFRALCHSAGLGPDGPASGSTFWEGRY